MRHSAGAWSGKTSEVPSFRKEVLGKTVPRSDPKYWDIVSLS